MERNTRHRESVYVKNSLLLHSRSIYMTKEITGKIEIMTQVKPTRKDNRFFRAVKISNKGDDWYNLFGNESTLAERFNGLEIGSDVKILFNEKNVNGKTFREILSINPIKQETLTPAIILNESEDSLNIPCNFEFTILENGRLSLTRLKDALGCWKSDLEWVLEEIDKIDMDKDKSIAKKD